MSTTTDSTSLHDTKPSIWYFGIPWTKDRVKHIFENAEPTTDVNELAVRARVEADRSSPYASLVFDWVHEEIHMILGRDEVDDLDSQLGRDPSGADLQPLTVLVLRKKKAISESDLDGSPDLQVPLATDAQVAELRRIGGTVKWYKKVHC